MDTYLNILTTGCPKALYEFLQGTCIPGNEMLYQSSFCCRDKCLRKLTYKEEKFILAYSLRGLSPQSLDPVAFRPVVRLNIVQESVVEETCSPRWLGSRERKEPKPQYSLQGRAPIDLTSSHQATSSRFYPLLIVPRLTTKSLACGPNRDKCSPFIYVGLSVLVTLVDIQFLS